VTHSPTAGVSYSVRRMLGRSFDAAIVMQIVICHSHGWQKSVLLVTDQPRSRHTVQIVTCHSHVWQKSVLPVTVVHVVVSATQGSSPRSFPRRVMPRRSQAEAGHVVVRHFFHWPSHTARRECQGQASTAAVTEGGIAVRIVMVRQREGGSELSSCSYLGQCNAI
jgi:hypothetical protein